MKKENKGITLIALVITIIVLLILASVVIVTLTGDNGLFAKAKSAADKNSEAEIEEKIKLAYSEWQIEQNTGTTQNANEFIKNILDTSIGNVEEVSVDNNALTVTINKNGEDKIYYYNIKNGGIKQIELAKNSNNKNDSYVGCYADIDEDGVVDGIIFADLLTGSIRDEQKWGSDNRTYSLPENITTDNVKRYYISQDIYEDSHFNSNLVISPIGSGEDRFYVMQLTDFKTPAKTDGTEDENYPGYTMYTWYSHANSDINDYATNTTKTFGSGKTNTRMMIEKWNSGAYGNVSKSDIWKHIQKKVECGWFIPTVDEWLAFANELGINSSNWNSTYGLVKNNAYWTSKQAYRTTISVIRAEKIDGYETNSNRAVRLATTF